MIVIDFMACSKKVKIKKGKVKTLGDFCQKVQDMILNLAKDSQRIDIVFEMHLQNGIKASTRKFRKKINSTCSSVNKARRPAAAIVSGPKN